MDDLRRKPVGVNWKRLAGYDAGDFPMAGGAILPGRFLGALSETGDRDLIWLNSANRKDVPQPELLKIGKPKPILKISRKVPECVAPLIAIIRSVRQLADSKAIKDDEDCAFGTHEETLLGPRAPRPHFAWVTLTPWNCGRDARAPRREQNELTPCPDLTNPRVRASIVME